MNASDQAKPTVEFKDGKLVCDGRNWSPFGIGVRFVAASLAVGYGRDTYGGPEIKVSLGGDAYIECQGLVVVDRHKAGVRTVSLCIRAESEEWLAENVEGVAPPINGNLPSRIHLGHSAPDAELELTEAFYVEAYIPRDLFEALLKKVEQGALESLWFSADFVGLYADFPYGQAKDTKLGLAPGRYSGAPARGRLKDIHWRDRPVTFSKPYWLARSVFPDAERDVPEAASPRAVLTDSTAPRPSLSLARVEALLSQIAVAARWIGWGLLAVAVVLALHLR